MFGNVLSIWGAQFQLSKLLNRDHEVMDYSTLNEQLSIESGVDYASGERPELGYLVFGRGGSVNIGTNDRALLQHVVWDGGLFEAIPVAVRELADDFPPEIRANYRLRKVQAVGGVNKIVYYGLKVDFASASPTTIVKKVGEADKAFTSTSGQITPTPVPLDADNNPITTTDTNVVVSAPIEYVLTTDIIDRIVDAVQQVYGSSGKAIITEMAWCHGVDRSVTNSDSGTSVTYLEAIGMQPYNFVADDVNLLYTSTDYTVRYDLSASLPLLT